MSRCGGDTRLQARLAVRRAVAQLTADPARTVAAVVNGSTFEERPIDSTTRLALIHLEQIFDQLQNAIIASEDAPPSSSSVLRFLSESEGETSKEIVHRFENRYVSARLREMEEWRRVNSSPLEPLMPAPIPTHVPPLDARALASGSLSPNSVEDMRVDGEKIRRGRQAETSGSGSSPRSQESVEIRASPRSSLSGDNRVWSDGSRSSSRSSKPLLRSSPSISEQQASELDEIAKKVTEHLMGDASFMQQIRNGGALSDGVREGPLVARIQQMAQEALPVVLAHSPILLSTPLSEEPFRAPSPSQKEATPARGARSSRSSQRSDDARVTCRYVPPKVPTAEVAVSTERTSPPTTAEHTVDVGVNTTPLGLSNAAEGSSSSNDTSELSAGQIPQKLIDRVLQRRSVNIVTVRGDGSVVAAEGVAVRQSPSVREWSPSRDVEVVAQPFSPLSSFPSTSGHHAATEGVQTPAEVIESTLVDDEEEIESVSALNSSQRSASEGDSNNTLAHISPLPKHS